jgi:LAS superfamily LD-carboxypeptidase LdcB
MTRTELKEHIFVGVVEDNQDPKKLGRCKCRVMNVYDELPVEDIPWATPWKDLSGNQFLLPEKGKVVSVVFDEGSIYKPEYIYAEHYNINLENKLKNLSGTDYTSMRSVLFDHSTQIYRNDSEGLKIDHEYTNINIDQYGNILLNLRDNKSVITLGSKDADEEGMLGTTFMDWFDEFIDNLAGAQGGPYLGNLAAPVIANPAFIDVILKYRSLRLKFVSNHVRLPKNDLIIPQQRPYVNQKGDIWKSTTSRNDLASVSSPSYQPSSTYNSETSGTQQQYNPPDTGNNNPARTNPSDYKTSVSYDIPTSSLDKTKFQNGKIPASALTKSKWANGDKKSKWISSSVMGTSSALLVKEAAESFDALLDLFDATDFPGKSPLNIADAYRTYETQVILRDRLGNFAARPGTSNHGWGLAVDFSGMGTPYTSIKKGPQKASAYRTPVYQWFFQNSWKFGIYNPKGLRAGGAYDEYWHWEFQGNLGAPSAQYAEYAKPFTRDDIKVLRQYGCSQPADVYLNTFFK